MHQTKSVDLGHGYKANIDVEIVKLIKGLNQLRMDTDMSCQNNTNGRVWVSFYMAKDAQHFLELIAEKSETLRHYVLSSTTEGYDKHPNRWKVKNRWWVDSYVMPGKTKYGRWTGNIRVSLSVRFPKRHLEEVTKIVVAEAKRQRKEDFEKAQHLTRSKKP